MVLREENIRFFIMILILFGLLIALGVFLYIVASSIVLAVFRNKSNKIINKLTNSRPDIIMSTMLKIAFILEMTAGMIILLLL